MTFCSFHPNMKNGNKEMKFSIFPLVSSMLLLLLNSTASNSGDCEALLQFSNSFTITKYASDVLCDYPTNTSYPKTVSWKNGTDCCSWDGVTCHVATRRVIGLNLGCSWLRGPLDSSSPLFSLPDLRRLNLAGNSFTGSLISPSFGNFTRMQHLNLSTSGFSGPVPLEAISHLSGLVTLDLSRYYFGMLTIKEHGFELLMRNLTRLRELYLDQVDMSEIPPISLSNLSSTLTTLSLSGFYLQGIFPIDILHRPNLHSLSVSHNYGLIGTLPETNWTSPIVSLDLSATGFHGPIPSSLGNLTSMSSLNLWHSGFTGTVDFEIFARLKNLESLSLGQNNITVALQSGGSCSFLMLKFLDLSGCNLTKFPYFLSSSAGLSSLDLSLNMISGEIPDWFGRIGTNTLTHLDLSCNQITGPLPVPTPSTEYFDASSNNITGNIPSSICRASSLAQLILSNNRLEGTLPRCFENLSSLSRLYLANNRLQGPIEFPLSPLLSYVVLSNNNFSGQLPRDFLLHSSVLFVIDISNNSFDGPIPIPPPNLGYYLLSKNKFHGRIHHVCDADQLYVVDLSNNRLNDTIPHCLINLINVSLSVLDLRLNKFTGQIPEIFGLEACALRTLRLSQNRLGGMLPQSLARCDSMQVLDLSENELEDRFPYKLDTLPNLQVLSLRSNKFHGLVDSSRRTDHPFPKLRIFDIAKNGFLGPLPAIYLAKLVGMKNEERGSLKYVGNHEYYQDSIVVEMKGSKVELLRILTIFTTIDFSSNYFQGEIPRVIGDLKALKGLNLSHNNLTGGIPSSFGNLTNLEWLDLSSNKLNGKIPRELADLTMLGWLNLSDNQLTGPIPQSTQFDTFKDAFNGNPGLCGRPLPKSCYKDAPPSTFSHDEGEEMESDSISIEWRAVPIGYGCGLVFGISAMYLMLETGRPRWLARMVA